MKRLVVAAGVIAAAAAALPLMRWRREVARVSPELRNPLLYLPMSVTNAATLVALRRLMQRETEPVTGVVVHERLIGPGLRVFVYEPDGRSRRSGALLWVHGGGRVVGDPVTDHLQCSFLARESRVAVVSVDYRLAPECPFPAALDDVMGALVWMHSSAELLGVDPARVAVGGASAGGGLAAEAAQRALDEGVPVAFQLLVYPMLDDRTVDVDEAGRGRLVWTAASNRFAWSAYLGHAAGQSETRPYAAAARRDDLTGLPPAWIGVGDLDLFFVEGLEYARRLQEVGVPVQVDVVPGMYHGADLFLPDQPPSMREFWQRMAQALAEGAGVARVGSEVVERGDVGPAEGAGPLE